MRLNTNRGLMSLLLLAVGTDTAFGEEPRKLEELPAPFTAAEFQKHAAFLASDELEGRFPGSEGSAKAAAYLINAFEAQGLQPLQADRSWFQEFSFPLPNYVGVIKARNLFAVFPGRGTLAAEAVIVAAHYDHLGKKVSDKNEEPADVIFNGADDNASGVAAMLQVAAALSGQKTFLPSSHRTVIFAAFDAEERGLLGADHYVNHPLWPLKQTAAVINFDSVGRLRMGKVFASDADTSPL